MVCPNKICWRINVVLIVLVQTRIAGLIGGRSSTELAGPGIILICFVSICFTIQITAFWFVFIHFKKQNSKDLVQLKMFTRMLNLPKITFFLVSDIFTGIWNFVPDEKQNVRFRHNHVLLHQHLHPSSRHHLLLQIAITMSTPQYQNILSL